jgi:hypothetical protein
MSMAGEKSKPKESGGNSFVNIAGRRVVYITRSAESSGLCEHGRQKNNQGVWGTAVYENM